MVGVGHGDRSLIEPPTAPARQDPVRARDQFTTEVLEAYADELASVLPVARRAIYPVSGGCEAVETALKMARAYHLAVGQAGSRR